MNGRTMVWGMALVLVWLSVEAVPAQDRSGAVDPPKKSEAEPKLPRCPVMDEPVDFNISTMTEQGPVYFCCKPCVKRFEKYPGRYAAETKKQRAALKKMERIQVNCPISGEPIDGKTSARIGGKKVSFCCKGCVTKYEKEPGKYAARLEASYTYQTRCPVMGEKINPTTYADLPTGERIYVCCKGCDTKLLKSPDKYAKKLEAQGIHLDLKKLKAVMKKKT